MIKKTEMIKPSDGKNRNLSAKVVPFKKNKFEVVLIRIKKNRNPNEMKALLFRFRMQRKAIKRYEKTETHGIADDQVTKGI